MGRCGRSLVCMSCTSLLRTVSFTMGSSELHLAWGLLRSLRALVLSIWNYSVCLIAARYLSWSAMVHLKSNIWAAKSTNGSQIFDFRDKSDLANIVLCGSWVLHGVQPECRESPEQKTKAHEITIAKFTLLFPFRHRGENLYETCKYLTEGSLALGKELCSMDVVIYCTTCISETAVLPSHASSVRKSHLCSPWKFYRKGVQVPDYFEYKGVESIHEL